MYDDHQRDLLEGADVSLGSDSRQPGLEKSPFDNQALRTRFSNSTLSTDPHDNI
jgi:hypothetical protein